MIRRLKSSYVQGLYKTLKNEERFMDRHKKFSNFCKQMSKLEQLYNEQEHQRFMYTQQLNRYALSGHEPLRNVLTLFLKNRKGFSSELILDTLTALGRIVQSNRTMPYMDLDPLLIHESWQFQVVLHDIRQGLEGKEYIPPNHLALMLDALANMKYKDAELVNSMHEYIKKQIVEPNEPYANQVDKEHVYSGFQTNKEFQEHIATLIEWKLKPKTSKEAILVGIEELAKNIEYLKLEQNNFASAIANINQQYYMLIKAQRENPELTYNDAVVLGLNELQEALVEAGILNPYELDDADNFENLDKLMSRAEKAFNNISSKYFPYMNNKSLDLFYEASKDNSIMNIPELSSKVPNPNTITAEVLGNYFISLGKMMNLNVGDVNESNDYPNVAWGRTARPIKNELDIKRELFIELPYTKLWIQGQKAVEDMLPHLKNAVKTADFVSACKVLYGLGHCRIYDKEIVDLICQRIRILQGKADFEVIAGGLYGLGMLNVHRETGKILIKMLVSCSDLEEIGFPMLIKAMWGACALNLENNSGFQYLFKLLNKFEPSDLTKEERILFRDVMASIEYELKVPNNQLSIHLNTAKMLASNSFFDDPKKLYDPLKPHLHKIGRFIMAQNMPETEATIIHKRVRESENAPMFKCDDVIILNGFHTYIFLSGSEGMHKHHLLGTYALKSRILKNAGKRGLPVPLNEIVDVDPYTPLMKMKSLEILNDFITEHVGFPENYLAQMDNFTSEYVKIMREEKESLTKKNLSILLLEDLVGAYKLQSMARCKTGQHLYAQGLEEVKLQLLKAFHRFNELDRNSQARIDKLAAEHTEVDSFTELLKTVNSKIPSMSGKNNDFWLGFRQFMHLPQASAQKPNLTDEIINHKFLMVPDYFQYNDWANEIYSYYPLPTDMALYEDDLFNNFHFIHRRQQIGMIPDPSTVVNTINDEIPVETRFKVLLTNLKYGLKRNFNDEQIIEKILGLEVLEKLIEDHLRPKDEAGKKLKRSASAFTHFVHTQIKQTEDTDQYVKFFREIWARDAVKNELFDKMRKNLKAVASSETLDANEKILLKNEMIYKYTNTKEALDIDDPERVLFYSSIFRQSFATKSDPRYLRKREYDLREDPDFMYFEHDKDYLSFKQRKAEANLIKLRIFTKLQNGIPLSNLESEYLAVYKQALLSSPLSQAGKVLIPPKVTSLKLENLPNSDKSIFNSLNKANYESLEQEIEHYSLNELLFELSHFLDDYLVSRIEFHILERGELEDWGITPDQNGGSKLKPLWTNKGLWWQNCALEEYIWRKASDFTEKEKKDFLTLFGYERNKSFMDQVYWKMDTKSFDELMKDLEGNDFKLNFVREFWQRKVGERKVRQTIPDGKFAQSDKNIIKTWHEEIGQENQEVFANIFGIQLDDVQPENFEGLVEELKRILYHQETETVKNMVRLIYLHPKIPERNKEDLYGIINSLNIEVFETGTVSRDPIKVRGDRLSVEISDEEWKRRLENASVNFLPTLINKIMN